MAKYIDADAYIKYCDEHWIALNVDAVNAQPAVDIPRWIPVTERLPEESGEYLVVLDSLIYFSWFYKDDGVWSFKNADITAWMKLPDPYKVGEEE